MKVKGLKKLVVTVAEKKTIEKKVVAPQSYCLLFRSSFGAVSQCALCVVVFLLLLLLLARIFFCFRLHLNRRLWFSLLCLCASIVSYGIYGMCKMCIRYGTIRKVGLPNTQRNFPCGECIPVILYFFYIFIPITKFQFVHSTLCTAPHTLQIHKLTK